MRRNEGREADNFTSRCSETVQENKRAKNPIGDYRLPQCARHFLVAMHQPDAERPNDGNTQDDPHPDHVGDLAQGEVQNVSEALCRPSAPIADVRFGSRLPPR